MKVALVYDRVNKWGGAERVLLALNKIFPDAPLYTSVYDKKKAPWTNVFKIKTAFLQNFPFASGYHEYYAVFMPLAFESFTFDEYDLVISVTSEAAKGIITKPGTLHICYCLTPTRYLWSGYNEYFKNPILRFFSKPVVSYLSFWDKIASQRPDSLIAISGEVQKRIKKYYGRDSSIIHPPLGLLHTESQLDKKNIVRGRSAESFFLIVSRLVPYKKIDLAIEVFNELRLPLKIIGTGIEENRLRRMAKANIEFLGYLTDKELVGYYKECQALIFPQEEDFGLTILEAQSFGKPTIALKKGGALDIVLDGKTGIFFEVQSKKSLEDAILKFQKMTFNPEDSIKNAEKFSFEEFKTKLGKEIKLATRN